MTGMELAMRLRERTPGLRVIYMSAEPEREAHVLPNGPDRARLLRKPFTLTTLSIALAALDGEP
jgi:hypothetical protein